MDDRIENILCSLLNNIETLDDTLIRIIRSELAVNNEKCLGLIEEIREGCISTLHSLLSLERKIQGDAFIIPEDRA